MAYANLLAQAVTNKEEMFKRFRDFLCKQNLSYNYSTTGIGWTYHDSSYAGTYDTPVDGDWFVVFSAGESGYDNLYFKVELVSNYIKVTGWLYWNNSTHTGVTSYNSTSNWTNTNVTASTLYIYGNLDFFLGISYYVSQYYGVLATLVPNTLYDRTVGKCAGSLSSGSGVSIVVDSAPASWLPGRKLFIRDNANIKIITIITRVSNTITADLTVGFSAGAKLCADMCYLCSSTNNLAGTFYTLLPRSGSSQTTSLVTQGTLLSNADPDNLNSEYIIRRAFVGDTVNVKYGGYLEDICDISTTGLVNLDVITDQNGVNWRQFELYTSKSICVREV
jgi:hypothetical protein